MWFIQLKGFIRQGDLSYSKGCDGEEGEDDNVKNDKDDMNDNENLL